MKKRSYFMDARLKSGEWVTLLYESAHRKDTDSHMWDIWISIAKGGIGDDVERISDFKYILNKKNKDEQCYGSLRIVDLR